MKNHGRPAVRAARDSPCYQATREATLRVKRPLLCGRSRSMNGARVERLTQGVGAREQRDIRLYGAEDLVSAIRDATDVTPDEPVLLLSFQHELYELNSAGAILWDALSSPRSILDLEELLSAFFGIPADQAASDAAAFVTTLCAVGLITTLSS
jgi:hypothetical protein